MHACLYLAQLQRRLALPESRWDGNYAVDFFEQFVNERIEDNGSEEIFEDIRNAALKLWYFDNIMEGTTKKDGFYKGIPLALMVQINASLRFLHVAANTTVSKDIKTAVVSCLFLFTGKRLADSLVQLESIAIWMLLIKPSPKVRCQRVAGILKELDHGQNKKVAGVLSEEEKADVSMALSEQSFALGSKPAKAILERINLAIMHDSTAAFEDDVYLEPILPCQPVPAGSNKYQLCNLVAMTTKVARVRKQKPLTDCKKAIERCTESPFPLSNNLVPRSSDVMADNNKRMMQAAKSHWALAYQGQEESHSMAAISSFLAAQSKSRKRKTLTSVHEPKDMF